MFTLLASVILIQSVALSQLRAEVSTIRRILEQIAKQAGVPDIISEGLRTELQELCSRGEKIKAIKRLRMATGMGLREAKDYVDAL